MNEWMNKWVVCILSTYSVVNYMHKDIFGDIVVLCVSYRWSVNYLSKHNHTDPILTDDTSQTR
jgi:hypothetical protein